MLIPNHHGVVNGNFVIIDLTWRVWDIHEDHDMVAINHTMVTLKTINRAKKYP